MKRILFISTLEAAPWGGSEVLWHYVAEKLINDGFTVGINRIEWQPVPEQLGQLINKGAIVSYRPNIHLPKPATHIAFRLKNVIHRQRHLKQIELFNPDRILINQGGNFDEYLERLAPYLLETTVPYIIICHQAFEHGYLHNRKRHLLRAVFIKAARVVFVSKRNCEVSERMLATHLPNAQVIYHPPITINKTAKAKYPTQEVINMACVARLDVSYKGQDVLLQALSSEGWKARNWRLNFYGSGPHQMYLEELIEFYQLQDKVFFKGYVANIDDIWLMNHILVLPSLSEGTPLALFESCYYSRPAVVTDIGGNKELIQDGETGFIAAAANASSISECLERAWLKMGEWEVMGKEARVRTEALLKNDHFESVIKMLIN